MKRLPVYLSLLICLTACKGPQVRRAVREMVDTALREGASCESICDRIKAYAASKMAEGVR